MADVGCAGILVADMFCGPMPRLPNAGELLAIDSMQSSAGGCAANVAIDLAKQGISVDIAGCVGRDSSADLVVGSLKEQRVNCDQLVRSDEHPTSRTIILLVEGEDRRYIHSFGANRAFAVADIDRDWVRQLKVFYLGGLFVMPALRTDELADLLCFCRTCGVITVVDVVLPQSFNGIGELKTLLPHIDYFLPNCDEAEKITGHSKPLDQMRMLRDNGAAAVVITCGPDGAIASRDNRCWQCPAYSMPAVDPSGAGDAFASGIIAGILHKWDMPQTLRYACAVGGSATLAVATTASVFDAQQAAAFIASHPLEVREREFRS